MASEETPRDDQVEPAPKRISRADRALTRVSLVAALVIVASAIFGWRETWPLERQLGSIRATGWTACASLLLSLVMTPAGRLSRLVLPGRLPPAGWNAYRRAFGVVAAVMALLHAALVLGTYLRGSWAAVLSWPYLRSGITALAILAALLVTSFPRLVAKLGLRHWKELHRLAYLAVPLVLHHLLLAPFASRRLTLAIFAAWAMLMALRLLPARR